MLLAGEHEGSAGGTDRPAGAGGGERQRGEKQI